MDVLLIGAGAVGATYGGALHRGGARVSYFVRARYQEEVARGLTLLAGRAAPETFVPHEVLSEVSEVEERSFSQVWLTMSSTALRGDWRVPLLEATGDAAIVCLQPGLGDHDLVGETVGPERVVSGVITYAAWESPLPGDDAPAGVAYVIPPFGKQPFSGPRAPEVVEALRAGSMASVVVKDAQRRSRIGSAALNPMITSLECAGWELARWPETLGLGTRAAQEALMAVEGRVPFALRVGLRPSLARLALPIARRAFPVDLETYLRVHFTKVGDQSLSSLGRLATRAEERGTSSVALVELRGRVVALRG